MALGAPAWCAGPAGLVLAAAFGLGARGRLAGALGAPREERRFALAAAGVGALAALPALVLMTPSGDDFDFFHRALWQLAHLSEPFTRDETAFGVPGLAAISPLHALTTWELGLAMAAKGLGLDALGVYHNGAVVVGNVGLALLVASWLRELGFGPRAALAGIVGVVAFLYADDPSVRSWGIAYRMLWVGKMTQWLLLLPLALLFAWRYLRAPSPARLWHPALCAVCAVGTSGTGIFLLPGVLAGASLAGLARGPSSPRRILQCGLLNVASLYCLGVAGLLISGVLPEPADVSAWVDTFPSTWSENLRLVAPHAAALVRNALLAFAVPSVLLRGDARAFLVGFGAALVAIFLNPLLGPLWLEAARPGAYWRVMLLFPVPLGAGIAVAALAERTGPAPRWLAAALAVVSALSVAVARRSPPGDFAVIAHRHGIKAPFEVRLPPVERHFVRRAAAELAGRHLLAARGISTTAALLVPGLIIEAARLQDTRHVFANAGRPEEGIRRLRAWEWASRCGPAGRAAQAAVATSVEQGVDAVIVVDCGEAAVAERRRLLERGGARFRPVLREAGYVLYLRE
jgi:hypothetical protein